MLYRSKFSYTEGILKVLFVSSEFTPLAKVGGLADAVAGLATALMELGHEVRVMLPLYSCVDRRNFEITFESSCCVHLGGGAENWVGIWKCVLPSRLECRFVDYEHYFARPGLYDEYGRAYEDNGWRFTLFCKASLQHCKDCGWIPDVLHAHDWPTGLCAVFLKTWDRILSPLSAVKTVFTIHNIGHQGKCPASLFQFIGVGGEHFRADGFEDHGAVNLLKAGINYSDFVTTVSPTHAKELITKEGGCGLDGYLLRKWHQKSFCGVLNGVDYSEWNPAEDRLIPDRFDVGDMSGKKVCKKALQMELGLTTDDDMPLLGCVTRLVWQKGVQLMQDCLHEALAEMRFQLVILGKGETNAEDYFRWLQNRFPGRVSSYIGFSNDLAHLIFAGADLFLMPSIYEPCGLSHLYAMRYGAVPLVRYCGGLADTVQNYNESSGTGTGFVFYDPTPKALYNTIGWAISTWYDRPVHFENLRENAMQKRFSWSEAAQKYEEIYKSIL